MSILSDARRARKGKELAGRTPLQIPAWLTASVLSAIVIVPALPPPGFASTSYEKTSSPAIGMLDVIRIQATLEVAVHGQPMEHDALTAWVTTVTRRVPPDAGKDAGVASNP